MPHYCKAVFKFYKSWAIQPKKMLSLLLFKCPRKTAPPPFPTQFPGVTPLLVNIAGLGLGKPLNIRVNQTVLTGLSLYASKFFKNEVRLPNVSKCRRV